MRLVALQSKHQDVLGIGHLAHESPVFKRMAKQGTFERELHMGKKNKLKLTAVPFLFDAECHQ